MARQLGDILVEAGIISKTTLERALERARTTGQQLGQALEEMRVLTRQELMEALIRQHSPFADAECRRRLGSLLVEARLISETTLERALARAAAAGKRLGETLEEMGVVTGRELVEALGRQLGFKTAHDLVERSYPAELLELLPLELVMQRVIFPLRRKDDLLALAIAEPCDSEAIEQAARISGLQIVPVLAEQREIIAAIVRHYLQIVPDDGTAATVLVAEDSVAVAAVVVAALNGAGYRVIQAADGVEALKLALTQRPDLIISDAQMPKLDGYALLRALKANPLTSHIPAIMLTARGQGDEEGKALAAGFSDFLTKPLQPAHVVARVKRALELVAAASR